MTIVLYRIDERLIHGQVVIGWGRELNPTRYLVVNDELASSEWEQDLYRLGLDEGTEAEFVGTAEAVERLAGWRADERRSVLLTRGIATMLDLARSGLLEGVAVNVGGIHHAEGRTRVSSYVHLEAADRAKLAEMHDCGVTVTARELPGSPAMNLQALLGA